MRDHSPISEGRWDIESCESSPSATPTTEGHTTLGQAGQRTYASVVRSNPYPHIYRPPALSPTPNESVSVHQPEQSSGRGTVLVPNTQALPTFPRAVGMMLIPCIQHTIAQAPQAGASDDSEPLLDMIPPTQPTGTTGTSSQASNTALVRQHEQPDAPQREYIFVHSTQSSMGTPTQPAAPPFARNNLDAATIVISDSTDQADQPTNKCTSVQAKAVITARTKAARPTNTTTRKSIAVSAKARGKQKALPPLSEPEDSDPVDTSDGPPRKKARTTDQFTEAEVKEAAITGGPSGNAKLKGQGKSTRVRWTPEDILAFVTFWYMPESYENMRENQKAGFQKASEEVFQGRYTPQKIKELERRLRWKYMVYESVMKQSGTGKVETEVGKMRSKLASQGHTNKISLATLQEFGNSNIYDIIHEALRNRPEVHKMRDTHQFRSLTPSDIETNTSDHDSSFTSTVEFLDEPTPPRKQGKKARGRKKGDSGNTKTDPALGLFSKVAQSIAASQKDQHKQLVSQTDLEKQWISIADQEYQLNMQRDNREEAEMDIMCQKEAREEEAMGFMCQREAREADAYQINKRREALSERLERIQLAAQWIEGSNEVLQEEGRALLQLQRQISLAELIHDDLQALPPCAQALRPIVNSPPVANPIPVAETPSKPNKENEEDEANRVMGS
ncbi:hypothetical protein CTheo_6912 [Ceratobasidium theobromae]|uniref:Uncharacterized protein n=1 Tax=Ceratobasidium theobromae TaxID=1582974 RepID=A0A5N5QDF5_9AGAM|nr:hypothetical protein CTheo_6912 [Ceratobasidium theobromae]